MLSPDCEAQSQMLLMKDRRQGMGHQSNLGCFYSFFFCQVSCLVDAYMKFGCKGGIELVGNEDVRDDDGSV